MLGGLGDNPILQQFGAKGLGDAFNQLGTILEGENALYVRAAGTKDVPEVTFIASPRGGVDGAAALMVPSDNTYYLVVDASGPYEFSFEQPTPETVTPVNQTSFTGKAQDVSPYSLLPTGPMTVTVQSDSTALQFWLYGVDDLGGGAVISEAGDHPAVDHLVYLTAFACDEGESPSATAVDTPMPATGLADALVVADDGTVTLTRDGVIACLYHACAPVDVDAALTQLRPVHLLSFIHL